MSAISNRSIVYVMDEIAGIDIDREIDFAFVEFLIKEGRWNFAE
jgi:CMP-N-acetylneuraminic acid synthetase